MWIVDGNLLVAAVLNTHAHHLRAHQWFSMLTEPFATCSVTQGTLLRLHMHMAADQSAVAAWNALAGVEAHPLHVYVAEDVPYRSVPHGQIQGHRQVTDAWIVELDRAVGAKVATLDAGLAASFPHDAELI